MKKANTRRSLLLSALSLLMCVSMLVGSTFAWFTDEVKSGINKIEAGNLDIELYHGKGNPTTPVTATTDDIFTTAGGNGIVWEPGVVAWTNLKVANEGSLHLKYQLAINFTNENYIVENGAKLSEKLMVAFMDTAVSGTREEILAAAKALPGVKLADLMKSGDLAKGASQVYGVVIYWEPSENDNNWNVYNGRTTSDGQSLHIDLGITLVATQKDAEFDSFGTDYDKEAVVTVKSPAVTVPTTPSAAVDQIITTPIEKNVTVTLPAAFLSDLAQTSNAPSKVMLSHAEPKINATANTIYFEHIELVDENGDIIDLEAMGNDKPVTVKFNVGDAFDVGERVNVYHDGELFATPVVDADKNVTYTATHFCEVFVAYNDGKINTANEFLATVAAVKDGDVITLAGNITFNKDAYTNNSGYNDGLYYDGDKSFTIDLNGYTITNDSFINDYLLNFRNVGEKANEITIKNGTLDATSSAYCALCTSGNSTQKITINLENVKLYNNISNGSTAKIRGGAELNVKAGTVITGKNSYLGIECWQATANIYDGAEIYMNGTGSYNGCLVGVGGNSVVNVYGGYGKGVSGGFIAMTSGGTINVYGGEWIANTDGAYANGNKSVLIAQSEKHAKSIVNVYGGTFKGGYNCYGAAAGDAQINISGGCFNANPASYLASGSTAAESNGQWVVGTVAVSTVDELKAAFNNAKAGDIILITKDITVTDKWDNRYGGRTDKAITIDGLGNTLKFTGEVNDGGNYHSAFRFNGAATVKNLTFDLSAAIGYGGTRCRAISAKSDLTVENCTFIGNAALTNTRAISYGEGAGAAIAEQDVKISGCAFTNWTRAITDNENAQDAKTVKIEGNTCTNAHIYVSAYENITVVNNTMNGAQINITSYSAAATAKVVATGNVLDASAYNVIGSASKKFNAANVTAQEGFVVNTIA